MALLPNMVLVPTGTGGIYPDRVWLEPEFELSPRPRLVEAARVYDRDKSGTGIFQFCPSPHDEMSPEHTSKLVAQLGGLREPVSFEVLGNRSFFQCQLVVQKRDEGIVRSAVAAVFRHSYLLQEALDPLYLRYREIRSRRLSKEYHLIDYASSPPLYLATFNPTMLGQSEILVQLNGVFQELAEPEVGFYQLIFVPCRQNWAKLFEQMLAYETLFAPEGLVPRTSSRNRYSTYSRYFAVALRAGCFVAPVKASSLMGKIHAVIRSLAVGRHRLSHLTRADYYREGFPRRDHFYLIFNRVSSRPGMVLDEKELAVLFPVFSPLSIESIQPLTRVGRTYKAPSFLRRSGQSLGLNVHQGQTEGVFVGPHLPNEHLYIVGKSGYGKTTLMERLIQQHVEAGEGFGVIDPHGDLVRRVLALIPEDRIGQTVYFHPGDPECRIPFNILAHTGSQREREHLRADLLDFFEELIGEKLGVRIEHVLNYCLVTLLSRTDSTLADIRRLLVDARFRAGIVASLGDPELIGFWGDEFSVWAKGGGLLTITNKLSPLLLPGSLLAPVLSSRANGLDFGRMMDDRSIFLCDLSQGALTRRNSRLLGRLVISRIAITAMMRDVAGQKPSWYLYVDEVQDVVSRSLEEILRGGRKFGLHLRLANQARKDLPESLRLAIGNAATLVFFCLDDVSEQGEAEKLLGRKFSATELGSIPRGRAVVKMDGHVFNLQVPAWDKVRPHLEHQVIEHTRLRFSSAEGRGAPEDSSIAQEPLNAVERVPEESQEMYDEL